MTYEIPHCPHCNTELERDDCVDYDYDSEGLCLDIVGHCPLCGRDYQWQENGAISHWSIVHLKEYD